MFGIYLLDVSFSKQLLTNTLGSDESLALSEGENMGVLFFVYCVTVMNKTGDGSINVDEGLFLCGRMNCRKLP